MAHHTQEDSQCSHDSLALLSGNSLFHMHPLLEYFHQSHPGFVSTQQSDLYEQTINYLLYITIRIIDPRLTVKKILTKSKQKIINLKKANKLITKQ